MSDLPPLTTDQINKIKVDIMSIRRGRRAGYDRPHKLVLLLAVIDLVECELITENKIYPREPFLSKFNKIFRFVRKKDDWCQPGPPFFHLRTSGIWFHKIKTGREEIYSSLKTTGGGIQKVQEIIEYAYLRDDVFQAFSCQESRDELKEYIISILNKEKETYIIQRLGTVFHETIQLKRSSLIQVMNIVSNSDLVLDATSTRILIREGSNLGTNYVKAIPRYGFGFGLLSENYLLSSFGDFALKYDPLLVQECTQWIMHYHMSTHQGPGPAFWHNLVITRFRTGDEFESSEVKSQIAREYEDTEQKPLADRSAQSTATIFLGTYTSVEDGLGNLGILELVGDNRYRVLDPIPPPKWAVAYALVDLWTSRYENSVTINLRDLYGDDGLTNIFMIGRGRLNQILEELQEEGLLQLHRIAPPYQLVLLYKEKEPILRKLYGVD